MTSPMRGALLAASLCAASVTPVQAAPIVFTDRTAFDAAVAALTSPTVSTLDFDAVAAGTLIADGDTLGGITFDYPTLAGFDVSLMVTDAFDAPSGSNSLGTDDDDVLQDGDDLVLSFAAVNAIGLYIIFAPDPLLDGDVELTAGGMTASLDAIGGLKVTLVDGGLVYFLGLVDSVSTFTSASITTSHDGFSEEFLWNADDIVTAAAGNGTPQVSEPGILALLGLGLAVLGLCQDRARRRIA